MSGLRKKTIACLVCALLVCLMTLLFVNLNFLTARAYTTGEQTAGGVTWKTSGEEGAVWTIGEDGSGVLTTQSYAQEDAIDNTFAVRPTMAEEAFGEYYTTHIKIEESHTGGANKIGFMYYLDADNYVFVKLSSWGGDTAAGNITGKIGGKPLCNETLGAWYEPGASVGYNIFTAVEFDLSAVIYADRCELYIDNSIVPLVSYSYFVNDNGTRVAAQFPADTETGHVYVGFGGNLKKASFGALRLGRETAGWTEDENFSYDDSADVLTGTGAGDADAVSYRGLGQEGAYELSVKVDMNASGVSDGDGSKYYKAGVIPYYLDENNFVQVWLQQWGADGFSRMSARGKLNGQWLNGGGEYYEPEGLTFSDVLPVKGDVSFTLRFVVTQNTVAVFFNGEKKMELYPAQGAIALPGIAYGVIMRNGGAQWSEFSVSEYPPAERPDENGWTSAQQENWSFADGVLTGSENDSDKNNDSYALHATQKTDEYEVSATISMNDSAIPVGTRGQLYKAGLVAYHKDEGNHVAIWLQQWGNDSFSRITATGKLNGQNLNGGGDYWEPSGLTFDDILPISQDTTFTLKCVVRASSIDIYLNDVYLDSIRPANGEIAFGEGLSYGAIVQNGTAQFADIAVKDYVPEAAKVLTVTVSDSESGERITGAEVRLGETALAEQGNGVYTMDVSELERGTLTVSKAEYQVWSQEIGEDVWSLPAVNVSVSLRSVNAPYTEQTREVGGVSWKVNGKNNGDEFTIEENGTVTMTAEPVQDEGNGYDRKIDQTYALRPTQANAAFGIRYTATLDIRTGYASNGCAKLGIFPFYLDQSNYVFVKLSSWGGETSNVNITGRINGADLCNESGAPWYEGGSVSYSLRAANRIKLSVCVFADRLYVYLGDDRVPALTYDYLVNDGGVKAASFGESSSPASVYTGVGGNLPEVVFSALAWETTQIVSNDLGGGWTSDYPFGWVYDGAEKSISGESISEAKALHVLEGDGAYVISAEIFMSESAVEPGTDGVYYKAGLVPFYKDADNWIAVWVQQWGSDANARLTAQGKIGGKVWSGMNDMGFWDGDWLPTLNPVLQPVSFTMKCEVVGRTVNIYINDEYVSSISAQGEIPYTEGGASYGVIVQNGTAQFSNLVLQDESAIVSETTVIVTVETIGGELVKDAIVKNGSVDFTNNGDGTYSLTVPVRTPVTVGVQKEGYVYLEYDVSSSAMYQPQVNITLQIAQEETIEIPEFDDIAPDELNVGALVGGIVGGVVGAAAIAVVIVLIVKKKRK